jgi:hypothetical protein
LLPPVWVTHCMEGDCPWQMNAIETNSVRKMSFIENDFDRY